MTGASEHACCRKQTDNRLHSERSRSTLGLFRPHMRPSKLGRAAHGASEDPDVRRGIRAVCTHHQEGNVSLSPDMQ